MTLPDPRGGVIDRLFSFSDKYVFVITATPNRVCTNTFTDM